MQNNQIKSYKWRDETMIVTCLGFIVGVILVIFSLQVINSPNSNLSCGTFFFSFFGIFVGPWLVIISTILWLIQQQRINIDAINALTGIIIGIVLGLISAVCWFYATVKIAQEHDEKGGGIILIVLSLAVHITVGFFLVGILGYALNTFF
jgi:hypothetical protein